MIKGNFYKTDEPFSVFSTVVRDVADKHEPIKQKLIRGINGYFMNSEHGKAIMNRSRIK